MRKLSCKDVTWAWQSEQEAAFKKIKQLVRAASVLQRYDVTKKVRIPCNASSSALGAVRRTSNSLCLKGTNSNRKQLCTDGERIFGDCIYMHKT